VNHEKWPNAEAPGETDARWIEGIPAWKLHRMGLGFLTIQAAQYCCFPHGTSALLTVRKPPYGTPSFSDRSRKQPGLVLIISGVVQGLSLTRT
jgi:hypothetical protein